MHHRCLMGPIFAAIFKRIIRGVEPRFGTPMLFFIFKTSTGMRSELLYWQYILWRQGGYRESVRLNSEERKRIFPQGFFDIVRTRTAVDTKPHVLELGPGPLSDLAWGVQTRIMTVVALDPLADEYARITAKNDIHYPIVPIQGVGERLPYKNGDFDAVYARNSLDHVVDPAVCVREAARVCRNGGIIYVCGTVREGSRVHWEGLHQHDLVLERKQLVRYGRDGTRTVLSAGLGLRCVNARTYRDGSRQRFEIAFEKCKCSARGTTHCT